MNDHRVAVLLRLIAVVGANVLGFVLLQAPYRHFESWAADALVGAVGGQDHSLVVGRTAIAVLPFNNRPFTAIITPSCSALASMLAIMCLASVTTRRDRVRRAAATVAALSIIGIGNIVRIAGSIGIGVLAGRSSLILFHDWIGGLLTFAYTLGGYVLLLYLILPRVHEEVVRAV